MAEHILVLDRGTTNVKASLFDRDLNQVAVATVKNPALVSAAPGWAEADLTALWDAAAAAVRSLWAKWHRPKSVRAVVVAGQGNGLILVDKAGKPVRRGILSLDNRANALLESWKADGRYAKAVETVRMPFGPGAPLPLMAWLKDHEPKALKTAHNLMFSKDWIRFQLTGDISTDWTDASGAGLIDAQSSTFATEVFGSLGLSGVGELMPALKQSSALAGYVTKAAAAATGLPKDLPVFTGAHDICACHNGLATASQRTVAVIFGTWAIDLFLVPADSPFPVKINHPEPGFFLSGAGDGNAGAVLDAMISVLYKTEPAKVAGLFAQVEGEVASAPASRALFVPHLFGHALDGSATGSFLGLDASTSRSSLIRAVYEGIMLSNCAYLASFPNFAEFDTIWLAGGGAKSKILGQILADTVGRPVHVARDSEMVGRGAAISGLIGLNDLARFTDAPKPAVARTFAPNPVNQEYYQRKLAILGEIMTSGAPLAQKLAALPLPGAK